MSEVYDHTPKCVTVTGDAAPLTYRQIIEQGLIKRGFVSKSFSHKKEPANRHADSLLLNFERSTAKYEIPEEKYEPEVNTLRVSVDFFENEVVIHLSHDRRPLRACYATHSGKVKIKQYYLNQLNPSVIFDYVDNVLQGKNPYLFQPSDVWMRDHPRGI